MAGLADNVKETASAPGTNTTFNLGGATAPFVTFASVFANGSTPYYFMMDATQWEAGEATLNYGLPNTLSRTTVLSNSAGTTARLNFAGTTTIYCALPAEKAVRLDQFSQLKAGDGYVTLPGNIRMQWGTETVTLSSNRATIYFPSTFSSFYTLVVSNGSASTSQNDVTILGQNGGEFIVYVPDQASGSFFVNWIAIGAV